MEYSCEFCHKKFPKRVSLFQHQVKHTLTCYHCYICSPVKKYTNYSELKNHWVTVHKGKRVKCRACQKEYIRDYCLKNHLCLGGKKLTREQYFFQKVNRIRQDQEIIATTDLQKYISTLTNSEIFSAADRVLFAEYRRKTSAAPTEQPFTPNLTEITIEMEEKINMCLAKNPEEKIVKIQSIDIYQRDLKTLLGINWLNDNIINSYLELIAKRNRNSQTYPVVHILNTFFYTNLRKYGYNSIEKWTKKLDIFKLDLLFIPLHLEVHWCLGVVDFRKKTISVYDSMGATNSIPLCTIRTFLKKEYKKIHESKPPMFTLVQVKNIPRQSNGSGTMHKPRSQLRGEGIAKCLLSNITLI